MLRIAALAACLLLGGFARPAEAAGPPSVDTAIRLQGATGKDAAIIVGNEAYQALPQATYAGVDARAARDLLMNGLGISKSRVLFAENVTNAQLQDTIKRGVGRVKKGGTLWIYYAGYGASAAGQRTLLGVDTTPESLEKGGMPLDTLLATASRSAAGRVIVIVDAGFGGVGRDALPLVPDRALPAPKGAPAVANNTVVWLADTGGRTVGGYPDGRHGMFTWLALGAMRGWADGALPGSERDGKVTLDEAQYYVSWTGRRMGRPMVPSEESRADQARWVLSQGGVEKGPSNEQLAELTSADRARRFATAEERLRAEAAAFWQQTNALAQKGGPEGQQALRAFIDEYQMPVVSVEWVVFLPEVLEAQRALATYGAGGAVAKVDAGKPDAGKPDAGKPDAGKPDAGKPDAGKPDAGKPDAGKPDAGKTVTTPTAPPPVASVNCDDLVALEGLSLLGQLSPEQVTCLQGKLATSRVQTTRNKLSRLLLVNAQTRGDIPQWEALMRRHLEEIDRSDPALCMVYAVHLHKKGAEFDDEAIYWAAYALENKQVWTGDEYVKRVYSLLRLRAEAAHTLWGASEKAYQQDATDENDAIAKEYRGMAKDFSREWLDYARASGQDFKLALELCRSASGSDAFCQVK